ncbi:MAG: alpha/beta fold hydrolase [Rhizobacter sp.]
MTPFFFGESSRRLFGLYTPAHAVGGKQRGIVLCQAWGQEYLRSHRSMRQLAGMLAAAGYHVLRFDYQGTGDSAGEMTDADLKGWLGDIETAIDELKDTAGLNRVGLLGLRLGAALAAQAATRRRKDVDALVLWDPVVSGADYVDELRSSDEFALARPPAAGGGLEVLGFPLTDSLSRELKTIDLMKDIALWPARSLVTVSTTLPSHAALRQAIEAAPGGPRSMEAIDSLPAWLEDRDTGAGAVPVKVLQRIVQWLT